MFNYSNSLEWFWVELHSSNSLKLTVHQCGHVHLKGLIPLYVSVVSDPQWCPSEHYYSCSTQKLMLDLLIVNLSKVSWHWKSLVELDQLWMPKCLRLGWCITFTPTPFEQGVWKRHYLETVQGLHVIRPQVRLNTEATRWRQYNSQARKL